MDMACLDNLIALSDHHPLVPSLLQSALPQTSAFTLTDGSQKRRQFFNDNKELGKRLGVKRSFLIPFAVTNICEETIVEYRLNEDQAVVLRKVISQLGGEDDSKVCDA